MSINSNNKKLIMDYINGNDIDIDIDTLENDVDFMIATIEYSNDINMYNLLNNEVKFNCEMTKFLLNKFHTNLDFIIRVADDFLDNYKHVNWFKEYNNDRIYNEHNTDLLEVLITIDKYLPLEYEPKIIELKMRLKTEFTKFRLELNLVDEFNPEEKVQDLVGKGFALVEMLYPTSYIIKDYFAIQILEEIRKEKGESLELYFHKQYKEVPKSAITVLLELVKRYDLELSNYIIARQEPFKEYIKEINDILDRWDIFEERFMHDRIDTIINVIEDYFFKNGTSLVMDSSDAIKYFASELGLVEQFKKYDPITFEIESTMYKDPKLSIADQKMIKELLPIIKGIMAGKNEYEAAEDVNKAKKVIDSKPKDNITEFRPRRG